MSDKTIRSDQYYRYIGREYLIDNPNKIAVRDGDLVIVNFKGGDTVLAKIIFHNYSLTLDVVTLGATYNYFNGVMYDDMFNMLSPVHWWSGDNRTVQSDIFKSTANILGLKNGQLAGLPGYVEDGIQSAIQAEIRKQPMQLHTPEQHIILKP